MLTYLLCLVSCTLLVHGQTTTCTRCDVATITSTALHLSGAQFPCAQQNAWSSTANQHNQMALSHNQGDTTIILTVNFTTYRHTFPNQTLTVPTTTAVSFPDAANAQNSVQVTVTCRFFTFSPTSSAPTSAPVIANLEQICENFVLDKTNKQFAKAMQGRGNSLPRCPPKHAQIQKVGAFKPLPGDKYCVLWPNLYSCNERPFCGPRSPVKNCVSSYKIAYYAIGKQELRFGWPQDVMLTCVYGYNSGTLVSNDFRGYFTRLEFGNPLTTAAVNGWWTSEGRVRRACCTNLQYCSNFYRIRPTNDGSRWHGHVNGVWGDPHFQSLDGLNITFNGVGEYVLIEHPTIRMQSRTQQAGLQKQGSVVMAVALQFSRAILSPVSSQTNRTTTVQIEVNVNNKTQNDRPFRVYVNTTAGGLLRSQNEIQWNASQIANNSEINLFSDFVLTISASNSGNHIRVSTYLFAFSMDLNLAVPTPPLRRLMQCTVMLSEEFANQTRGIFGNFNGDPKDDLMFPSGRMLDPAIATVQQVYQFGSAYQVSSATTLFAYTMGNGVTTFMNSSYVPMLVPNFASCPTHVAASAAQTCGASPECALDTAITCSLLFGAATRQFQVDLEQLKTLLSEVIQCHPPCGNGICRVNNHCECFTGWNGTYCDNATFPVLGATLGPTRQPSVAPTQMPTNATVHVATQKPQPPATPVGMIVGIVIGSVVFVGCIVFGVWYYQTQMGKEEKNEDGPENQEQEHITNREDSSD